MSEWQYAGLNSCASTNDEARRWASENPGEKGVIWTREQTAGRGRLGRAWYSRPEESLMLSLVFPSPLPAERAPQVTLLGAAALARACVAVADESLLEVKWPNDLLLSGGKVAGILTEWIASEGAGTIVMGVGLNLGIARDSFPEEIRGKACSLFEGDVPDELGQSLMVSFVTEMERLLAMTEETGLAPLHSAQEWMRMGKSVVFHDGQERLTGTVAGLTDGGALRLRTEDGSERVILAGDVLPLEWEE